MLGGLLLVGLCCLLCAELVRFGCWSSVLCDLWFVVCGLLFDDCCVLCVVCCGLLFVVYCFFLCVFFCSLFGV